MVLAKHDPSPLGRPATAIVDNDSLPSATILNRIDSLETQILVIITVPVSKIDVATEAYGGINTSYSRTVTAGKTIGFHDSAEGVPSGGSWRQTDHHCFSLVRFEKFAKFCCHGLI